MCLQPKLARMSGTGNRINNRRAWEFRTYVYIPPNKSTAKFCVGADGIWVDDNAYITLSPSGSSGRTVVSTPRDAWSSNIYEVSTGSISGGGYYELIYRIVNQNAGGSDEEAQGGYGKIGMAFDGDACNVTNFDNAIEAGFPASITIANPTVDLSIAKSNGVTSVNAGASTAYTVRVNNNGPSTIDSTILNDVIGTGLSATAAVCSAAASNRCTVAPNLANLTGAGVTLPSLASGQFYEISVTANVSGSGSVINSARVSLPASNTASNTGASCVTSGGITRSFNTTTGACTSTDTDTIVVPSPPLQCASNLYTLQGDTATGFRNLRSMQPDGTLGTVITQVPLNGAGVTNPENNAGLAINPSGTKVFVTTPQNTLRVYDVVSNTWEANVTVPSGIGAIRATVTSNGIGYLSSDDKLWTFQTSSPYTVSGPVNINSINGGPAPTLSNGDFFSDTNGNLFLLANPTASGTTLNLYRIAANGNSLYLGTVTSPNGQYGGYAAIPSGIYASSVTGNILRADLATFVATQTAGADSGRGSSDLASCFYPNLNPVIQSLKTSSKVAGSAGTEVRAGDTLEYRIVIRNIGTVPAADVKFQDSIPAGTTYVAGSTTYNYTTASGKPQVALADVGGVMPFVTARTIESPAPNLSSGILFVDSTGSGTMALVEAQRDREVVITFRVTVNASAISVSNQGTASYISDPGPPTTGTVVTDDPNTPTPNDSTTTTVFREADLSVTKTNSVTSLATGSATVYTIVVSNAGPSAANGAVFRDAAATGLTKTNIVCVAANGAVCPTAATIPAFITAIEAGIAIPTLPTTGSLTFTITADVTASSGSVTNTAVVTAPTGVTEIDPANNTASDTDSILAAVVADPATNEARFTIVPDLPTIFRGGTGTQLVTITNNGPNSATGTIATFIPAPQAGVSVTAVNVVGGAACTFASGEWSCPVGGVANGANFQLNVSYSTTAGAALNTAQQATIKVRSNEFNPGSGVGETLYKVWGSNEQNEMRPNGAFWVGYTGTGGSAQVGANSDENTPVLNAWPAGQTSPTGAYLTQANIDSRTSVYGASSTTASPMIQRVVTDMSTDADRSVNLTNIAATSAGDNRRAWEYRTGVYVPTAQSVSFCIGNTTLGIDDNAYIVVDGVVQGVQDSYVPGGFVSASLSLSAGYHSITYRMVNQNTYAGGAERSAGGYGQIGISLGGTCNTANLDAWTNTAVPASINIIDAADLSITKTNGVAAVDAGSTTAYTVVVSNAGPSAANGALFRDIAAAGLSKTSITCTATGGAVCPTAPISVATVEGATGIAIPTLPSGGVATFTVNANVTATGGSVTNTATVTAPAGVTEIDPVNNTASDTDTVNGLVNISGRVFTDNSGTTAIAANAYNGIQDAGELGIAGSTVELNNCSGSVIATTQTDAAGDYSFAVTAAQLSSPNFCITQTNLTGYSSVSGTTGYVRATDTITVAKTAALTYPNHNFGDARLNLILTSDGQQTTTPSGTVSYPHILRSDSVLTVGALTTVVTESPTLGWTSVLYRDNNCNGTIEASELPLTAALGVLLPNQDVCVVQRVNAPATASNGAQHVASLSASYTATAQDGGVLSGSSNTRTDTTLVGTAGLDMRKQVRVVEQCLPTVIAGVEPFTDRNTAQNGDFLEYEIIYTNRSTRNLSEVRVRDVAPSSTTFKSAACQSTPSGSSCTAPVTAGVNGDLAWSLANIAPAATGSVRFCVRVPPLAETPIRQ